MELKQELKQLRKQIDLLDCTLIKTFEQRMELSSRIGKIKAADNMMVVDEKREQDVLDNATSLASPQNRFEVSAFMRNIMELSKIRQHAQVSAETKDFLFPPQKIAIIGLGLIGGSLALALKNFRNAHIVGVDKNVETQKMALEQNAVDSCADVSEALSDADVAIFCVFPNTMVSILQQHGKLLKRGCVVADVVGVKQSLIKKIAPLLPDYADYISCHPMAGKAKGGFENASPELFKNAGFLITPIGNPCADNMRLINDIAKHIGASKIVVCSAEEHDKAIAYTSHLPHLIASSLSSEFPKGLDSAFIGGAFRDATRVAEMSPELWCELLLQNNENVICEINRFSQRLDLLKQALHAKDKEKLFALILKEEE